MQFEGHRNRATAMFFAVSLIVTPAMAESAKNKAGEETAVREEKVLWQEPLDIESRNLLYGQGGKEHQPSSTVFDFGKEDMSATNPKFTVTDAGGVKWKVKLGAEAKPETVATRFVWAVGYFTDEDYFLREARVKGMPNRIHRGRKLVGSDGTMKNARLERDVSGEKKEGQWKWKDAQLSGTREWNGLRVMMALINNWDLKDENNTIYSVGKQDEKHLEYVVSDLGATFGPERLDLGRKKNKGDLKTFQRTSFIQRTRAESVDFTVPGAPSPIMIFNPIEYFRRRGLMWIGHNIPRRDAHWMGTILSRLSAVQIRDAFRAGGYAPDEVEVYSTIIEKRIAALNEL
jgi:hypothetical protein